MSDSARSDGVWPDGHQRTRSRPTVRKKLMVVRRWGNEGAGSSATSVAARSDRGVVSDRLTDRE
jgi:hypothetical protein